MKVKPRINRSSIHRFWPLYFAVVSISTILVLSVVLTSQNTFAETPRGPGQPYIHGYNAKQLKNWSPESDPYAKYFRSHVPLADRIQPFQSTQANENLTTQAKVMSVSADYDKEQWFSAYRHYNSFSRNSLKFWQYQDIYSAWHGLPVYGSPKGEDRNPGVVNIPNPAYTDAAHRNGVMSLGGWFWPRDIKFSTLLEKDDDGHFIVADKMIEMADYFGFEGYFINQEDDISEKQADTLMKMLKYMREQGLYITWYDSLTKDGNVSYQNQFNKVNAPWLYDKHDGRRASDSIFLNYAFTPNGLEKSANYAQKLGLDPYKTVFAGIENDKYQFGRGLELDAIFHNDKSRTPRTSLALFGTDMVWYRGPNPFDDNMQKYIEKRERAYWSGPRGDPSNTGRKGKSESKSWPGVAQYIPARSVIGSYPFVTRFNTGHGKSSFRNGSKASEQEWSNMSAQDILPTWQWWTQESGNSKPLKVSYDYKKAWNGGSSVRINGELSKNSTKSVQLYKTELQISKSTQLSLKYALNGLKDESAMQAMLTFKDDPDHPVYEDLNVHSGKGWKSTDVGLSKYKGRTLAAIGLRYKTSSDQSTDFTAHLGELKLTDGHSGKKPEKPTGFKIDKAYYSNDHASFSLRWDFTKNKKNIWYYDLYNVQNGQRKPIGRIYGGVYYAKSVNLPDDKDEVKLALVAVSNDGHESSPATVKWHKGDGEKVEHPEGPFPVTSLKIVNMNTMDKKELNMEKGWTRYVNVKAEPSYASNIHLQWKSSDESVAVVNQRGKVTAKGSGKAMITAQAGDINGKPGKKIEIPVTVQDPQVPPQDGITLQAENYDQSTGSGLYSPGSYVNVRDLYFADSMAFNDVNFGSKGIVRKLKVRAAVMEPDTKMKLRLGGPDGRLLANVKLSPKNDNDGPAPAYENYTVKLNKPLTGKHKIYISFGNPNFKSWSVRADGIVDVDWMNFQTEPLTVDNMIHTLKNFKGKLAEETYRSLHVHLISLDRFEEKEKADKVIKHINGFKTLLEHQRNNGLMPKDVYKALKEEAEILIDRWEK